MKADKARVNPQATIRVTNLRLRTYIGFNPEEKQKKQDVVLNLEIAYRPTRAALDDSVSEALNYTTVTKRVISHLAQP